MSKKHNYQFKKKINNFQKILNKRKSNTIVIAIKISIVVSKTTKKIINNYVFLAKLLLN